MDNDYKSMGLSLEDIRAIMEVNPNLTEKQLWELLDQYKNIIKNNPNLVKKLGALAVFQQFVALSAYDPAHGGNYATHKTSNPQNLYIRNRRSYGGIRRNGAGLIDGPVDDLQTRCGMGREGGIFGEAARRKALALRDAIPFCSLSVMRSCGSCLFRWL